MLEVTITVEVKNRHSERTNAGQGLDEWHVWLGRNVKGWRVRLLVGNKQRRVKAQPPCCGKAARRGKTRCPGSAFVAVRTLHHVPLYQPIGKPAV